MISDLEFVSLLVCFQKEWFWCSNPSQSDSTYFDRDLYIPFTLIIHTSKQSFFFQKKTKYEEHIPTYMSINHSFCWWFFIWQRIRTFLDSWRNVSVLIPFTQSKFSGSSLSSKLILQFLVQLFSLLFNFLKIFLFWVSDKERGGCDGAWDPWLMLRVGPGGGGGGGITEAGFVFFFFFC